MSAYITSIGTANPKNKISQQEVLHFMQRAHGLTGKEARQLEVLYRATGIQYRYSVLEDYKKTDDFDFFPNNASMSPFPSTSSRDKIYQKEAVKISKEAVKDCLGDSFAMDTITHLITVSCTGLYAPGLDIELVNNLGLNTTVERTAINFMGCYAAFNALKVARSICQAQDARVLIVCTELCSLHFQKENTENNYLANALFGDGSAAVLVSTQSLAGVNLSLEGFQCDLLPQGNGEMAWAVGDNGFEMKLSAYVPEVIKNGIAKLLIPLKERWADQNFDYYAIHPGGRKILHVLEEKLGIDQTQNRFAYDILKNYGNMSSPTILFVLKQLMDSLTEVDAEKNILSFAFGPGLTLESMVLNVAING